MTYERGGEENRPEQEQKLCLSWDLKQLLLPCTAIYKINHFHNEKYYDSRVCSNLFSIEMQHKIWVQCESFCIHVFNSDEVIEV